MSSVPGLVAVLLILTADPLTPGDHTRSVRVGDQDRPYLVHVPPSYDPQVPTPLVLALHPFATNGPMMALISGLSGTADREGFLVAYPNGTGRGGMLHWNVGAEWSGAADDMGYIAQVLDDLATVANVDPRRIYAIGFSNGAMMCYRLASELSDRIAAIAPVAGTTTTDEIKAKRPVPVLHFHGTKDSFVSFQGTLWRQPRSGRFRGVEATVRAWAEADGCPGEPVTTEVPRDADDGLVIKRVAYGPGRAGSEVVLYVIEGGGHTWPGRVPPGSFLGKSALDLEANDLIWEFFLKHPMK
jgi:polyhydroxybutyrate depolymerase